MEELETYGELLVKHYSGSHAYGTATPNSDIDFRGIFCADPVYIRTPFFNIESFVDETEQDTTYWELSHFIKLYLKANINIVETLWVDPDDLVKTSREYEYLRGYRAKLMTTRIAKSVVGYSHKRIQEIRKRSESEDPDKSIKDAVGIMRILRMGAEFLETGEIKVRRPDANQLRAIRQSGFDIDKLSRYVIEMDDKITHRLLPKADLPDEPDYGLASQLIMAIQDSVWKRRKKIVAEKPYYQS